MTDPAPAPASPDRVRIATMALIFFASLMLFFLGSPVQIFIHDEGLILTGALRVMDGEQPAADFYVLYGPAQFYILAWIFELFGPSVTVGRVYDSVLLASVVCAAYWVARDFDLRESLPIPLALIVLFLLLHRSPLYPVTPTITLMLLGCGLTIRALAAGSGAGGFLPLGAVVAAFTLFRIDFGLIAIAAFGSAILVTLAMRIRAGSERLPRAAATILGVTLIAVLAFATPVGALYLSGFLEPAMHDFLAYGRRIYVETGIYPSLVSQRRSPVRFMG